MAILHISVMIGFQDDLKNLEKLYIKWLLAGGRGLDVCKF